MIKRSATRASSYRSGPFESAAADQPRVQFTPADFTSMQQQFEFVSFVRGNLDTCWCRFRFEHRWTAANGRTAIDGGEAPTRVNMIAGRNCQIIP